MRIYLLDNTYKVIVKEQEVIWNKEKVYKKERMSKREAELIKRLLKGDHINELEFMASDYNNNILSKYPFIIMSEYYEKYINTKFDRTYLFMRSVFGVDVDFISNLSKIKVLILGLGGVGCCVLNHCIRMGICDYQIIEFDKVAESNLNRQEIYTTKDIGKNKVDVIEKYILKNEECKVSKHNLKLTKTEELVAIIATYGCDIIINCADFPLYKIDYMTLKAAELCGCSYATAKVGLEKGRWSIFDDSRLIKKEAERNLEMSREINNQTAISSSLGIWNNMVVDYLCLDLFFYFNKSFMNVKAYNKYKEILLRGENTNGFFKLS